MAVTTRLYRIERSAGSRPGPVEPSPAVSDRSVGVVRAALVAGTGLRRAMTELEAVVADAARAAHAILAASEEIDGAAERLRVLVGRGPAADAIDDISERALAIFQACDFQDLTGQRIGNVVGLLADLESRLAAVRAVVDTPADVSDRLAEEVRPRRANAGTLENGPRLQSDDGHLTQAQVDRMLADEDERGG
ncbi:protein phosphatase CheZ [Alsobacter sp. R-9]